MKQKKHFMISGGCWAYCIFFIIAITYLTVTDLALSSYVLISLLAVYALLFFLGLGIGFAIDESLYGKLIKELNKEIEELKEQEKLLN